jgi:hypothetical protein
MIEKNQKEGIKISVGAIKILAGVIAIATCSD